MCLILIYLKNSPSQNSCWHRLTSSLINYWTESWQHRHLLLFKKKKHRGQTCSMFEMFLVFIWDTMCTLIGQLSYQTHILLYCENYSQRVNYAIMLFMQSFLKSFLSLDIVYFSSQSLEAKAAYWDINVTTTYMYSKLVSLCSFVVWAIWTQVHKAAKLRGTACLDDLYFLLLPLLHILTNPLRGFVNRINTANQNEDHNEKLPANLTGKSHCDTVKSIKTKLSDVVFAWWRRSKEESREV